MNAGANMEPDQIADTLKRLGNAAKEKLIDTMGDGVLPGRKTTEWPPMRDETMMPMEPDWDEIDRRANGIILTYTAVSAAANLLPFGLDIAAVTATFSKMATELSGVYQVLVSAKRARQMGFAIATTTVTVLGGAFGAAYAGSRLAKFIPGAGYLVSVAIQAPITAAVAWAAGETLKHYFKDCRRGTEPSIQALSESFAKTLHLKIRDFKGKQSVASADAAITSTIPVPPNAPPAPVVDPVEDCIEKLASLHALMHSGAITAEEYELKKAELLSRI